MIKLLRKISLVMASLLVLLLPLTPLQIVHADGPNLVLNPSVETTNIQGLPNNWSALKSGTNVSTFTYVTTVGNIGTHSLLINMSNRTNGDAKWRSDPILIKSNQKYSLSDFYKATSRNEFDLEYSDINGVKTVVNLPQINTSNNWAKATQTFTSPANAVSVIVMHTLLRVGSLQTDDYSLNEVTAPPTVTVTSPALSSLLSGIVPINANATNAAGVQFKVDDISVGAEVLIAPFTTSWNTTVLANGIHTVSAVARNSTGTTATSSVSVNVFNNTVLPTAPTVTITAPYSNATVSGTGQALSANVTSAQTVSGVQFKIDGINIGTEDMAAPYFVNWDTTSVANGIHIVTATGRTTNNLSTTSTTLINVQNLAAPAPPTNLISNPSVESATSTIPTDWTSSSWGANTPVFTYESTGHTGTHSVKTTMTGFVNGDGKWFFAPVTVTAGQSYDYSHFYQSSVTTDVVAQFTNASGVDSYKWLNTLASSATWQQFSSSFVIPAGTVKLTVLHVIYSVGFIQIDDASLTTSAPAVVLQTGEVLNSSMETSSGNPAIPNNWQKSSWGTNTSTFEYLNEGHTGTHSTKVTVSNYVDGDGKWFFNPLTNLTRGGQYRFSAWYKTNTTPHAVAVYTLDDGTNKFFGMPNPQSDASSATTWQFYTDTFQVPTNAKDLTVYFFMPGNGWVQIDDQAITPYQPVAFNRPLVTLTFDDGAEENITTALPLLNQFGFKSTQCFATSFVEGVAGGPQNVAAFKNTGHEICSHTVTHPFMTQIPISQLTTELVHSQQYLQSLTGSSVLDFASPYGDYNSTVNNEIKKYYRSHRTVDEGYNTKDNFGIYRLRVQNMTPTTSLAQYQAWINEAKAENSWLILVYHKVTTGVPDPYDTLLPDFQTQLQAIKNSGITVKTYSAALDELTSQL